MLGLKTMTRFAIWWTAGLTLVLVAACAPTPVETPPPSALSEAQVSALVAAGVRKGALETAVGAYARHARAVRAPRYLTLVDFARRSTEERMAIIDLNTGTAEQFLVAHGQGSDPDHDGYADRFSNIMNSRMSSLGAFVTAETYIGENGLSLRLDGLEPRNNLARARAIVVHGADYVAPGQSVLGRSWGCPVIEPQYVDRVLPQLAGGSFLYIAN